MPSKHSDAELRPRDQEGNVYEAPACHVNVDGDGEETERVDLHLQVCPYFKRDRGDGRVVCEGASFRFPDKLSRREYLYRFCAHPQGYKSCPLKVALDHYYERKYEDHA